MKIVKIFKASKPTYWYAKDVGVYLKVYSSIYEGSYQIFRDRDGGYGPKFINIDDCVEMTKDDYEILKEIFG